MASDFDRTIADQLEILVNKGIIEQQRIGLNESTPQKREQLLPEILEIAHTNIMQAVLDEVLELIDKPVDIFLTNDLPSMLDGGDTAAKHFGYFRDKLRKAAEERFSDNARQIKSRR